MSKKCYFLLFFMCSFAGAVFAQPEYELEHQIGCHFHKRAQSAAEKDLPIFLATNERSDTFDILDYDITLDVSDYSGKSVKGACKVTFVAQMENLTGINLDLEKLTVDSVWNDEGHLVFSHLDPLLKVEFSTPMQMGDTAEIWVAYGGKPYANDEEGGFGGFYFENNYTYNLSIGIGGDPVNFGRVWFPCFDNFKERSTYHFQIISSVENTARCSGDFVESVALPDNKKMWKYVMPTQLPTYLASVAVSKYESVSWTHDGQFRPIPVNILAKAVDTTNARKQFSYLDDAISALESWYGEMPWSTVGYSITPRGAMENPNNIIYPEAAVKNLSYDNRRLMAHELCHYWWGNTVNPKTASDMWIKEGNAEYGAHLLYEYIGGAAELETRVSDNLNGVLKTAHVDDGDYLPLSPMPKDQTYGTHTYNKGAAVIHNLRAYLGDDLFKMSQREALSTFYLGPMDALEYRDILSATSGVDLSDFFNDWIFAPGYSDFEIDSFRSNFHEGLGMWVTQIFVQQKLRRAPHFHNNTPVFLTILDENYQEYAHKAMMSGEFATIEFTSVFEPKFVLANTKQEMNIAQFNDTKFIASRGISNFRNTSFQLTTNAISDTAFIHVEHHWTAPDKLAPAQNPTNVRFSENHYWSVKGKLPEGYDGTVQLTYDGTQTSGFIDEDLLQNTEDSLILIYREKPGAPWVEYPNYRKDILSPIDKKGFIRIQNMRLGDYAFANGKFQAVSVQEFSAPDLQWAAFPNPASDLVQVNGFLKNAERGKLVLSLHSLLGQTLKSEMLEIRSGSFEKEMSLNELPAGVYFLKIGNADGRSFATEKLVKH